MPLGPFSRPTPLCFMPPKGAAGSSIAVCMHDLLCHFLKGCSMIIFMRRLRCCVIHADVCGADVYAEIYRMF